MPRKTARQPDDGGAAAWASLGFLEAAADLITAARSLPALAADLITACPGSRSAHHTPQKATFQRFSTIFWAAVIKSAASAASLEGFASGNQGKKDGEGFGRNWEL